MKTVKLITFVALLMLSLPFPVKAQNMGKNSIVLRVQDSGSLTNAQGSFLTPIKNFYLPIIIYTANANPLVWYDFEGDFLTTGIIEDRSGNGHDAQLVGSVSENPGISYSQGILFSGGYIQTQDNLVAGRTVVTFSLWFKTEHPEENYKLASAAWWDWGPGSGWIIATHGPEFWSDDNQGLILPDQPNNENDFPSDQWVHEAITYDGVRIKEYTNGQLINDWITTGAAIGMGLPMAVGAWPQYNAYNFQGSIDEFQIFERALTLEEVQAIYNYGLEPENNPPFFTSSPLTNATPDMLYTYTVTAEDPDVILGDALTIAAPTLPAWLTLVDHGDGSATISGTPTDADVGQHSIVLRVTDSEGLTATQVFSLIVEMAGPRIWQVAPNGSDVTGDGSEANPFAHIQHGIDVANHGDTVLVHPGVFQENINFNSKNIIIGSLYTTTGDETYILQTVIDGNHNGSVVTFSNGEDATAKLSGFTIVNGYAHGTSYPGNSGGGSFCLNSSPTLTHLRVFDNEAVGEGGGLYFAHCSSTVKDVIISNNLAGRGGGGIRYSDGIVSLENAVVTHNSALAGSGIQFYHAEGTIRNALIADNSGGVKGGGLQFDGCSPTFINVTVVGNWTAGHGGGLNVSYMSQPKLVNSIVWGNSPEQIYFDTDWGGEAITIEYSDIQGGAAGIITNGLGPVYWGEGNLDLSPHFMHSNLGNYRLADTSPCIGSGKVDGAPITDIENAPRPNPAGSNPDMGAYENPLGLYLAIVQTNLMKSSSIASIIFHQWMY